MGSASNNVSEDVLPHHTSTLEFRFILELPSTCFDQDIQHLAGTIPFSVPPHFNDFQVVQEY